MVGHARPLLGTRAATFGGDSPAFLGTTPACFRAFLAMRHLVPGAFLRAGIANGRADVAKVGRKLAAARHIAGGEAAYLRAVDIELDATRHLCDVLLCQARRGAVIAGGGTIVAGVDAGFEAL